MQQLPRFQLLWTARQQHVPMAGLVQNLPQILHGLLCCATVARECPPLRDLNASHWGHGTVQKVGWSKIREMQPMHKKTPIRMVTKHEMFGLVCWSCHASYAFSTGIMMKFASIKSISKPNMVSGMSQKYDSTSSNLKALHWNGPMEVQHLAN